MSDTDEVSSQTLLRQQIVLAKFGEFALRSNNLDKILNEACRLVGEALGTDLAKVMELQEDGLTLSVRAGVGWKPDVVGVVTLKTGSHTSEGHALATGEPVISPNIATETRFKYPAFLTDNGVKAVANVIIIGGKDRPPFGIIQIDSREPREFTENNLVFLKSYANLLAAAVDRLRVVDETRNGQVKLDIALAASEMGSWEVNLRTGLAICTPRFKEIFGYANSSRDWMFDTFLDHVIPDDRAHVEAAFRNTVASGNECRFECRIRHETTGETRFIEMRGGRIGDRRPQPCNMHIIGIITDITHRVRAEERNRQSQRLEAVGHLTAGVAHDFNNLLQSLLSNLELAIDEVPDQPEVNAILKHTLQITQRGSRLTSHLLSFSRQQVLQPAALALRPFLTEFLNTIRRTLGVEISIYLDLQPNIPNIFADDAHLDSALLNLVINACDALNGRGEIRIQTRVHERMVVIAVVDTGKGMDAETLLRACEPFYTTKGVNGSGLGLAMVQGFAQQSEGELHIESIAGKGTKVEIWLPIVESEIMQQPAASLQIQQFSGRILFVDDDLNICHAGSAILRKAGFDVVAMSSAKAAIAEMDRGLGFDIVITDYAMREMNGDELAHHLRKIEPGLPIVIITGYNKAKESASFPLDVIVLGKPFRRQDLVSTVTGLLQSVKNKPCL